MLTQLLLAARVLMGQPHSVVIRARLEAASRWLSGLKHLTLWHKQHVYFQGRDS